MPRTGASRGQSGSGSLSSGAGRTSTSNPEERKTAAVVFDLDDTLYPERQYARSGLAHVGALLARDFGISGAVSELIEDLDRGERKEAFDRLITRHRLPPAILGWLVEAYRAHEPAIVLFPEAAKTLTALRRQFPVAILTDGPLASQRAKIGVLGLAALVDAIVINDEWGPENWKPSTRGFERIEELLAPSVTRGSGRFCYVGDNPVKDFLGARRRGWLTIEIRHANRLDPRPAPPTPEHAADLMVASFAELLERLSS